MADAVTTSIAPLRTFVQAMTALADRQLLEAELLPIARGHLARLLARDHWLPAECARALPDRYAQYLLHCDPQERFSVLSFVWGPGQTTPVHNHTVWGLVGVLRGAERCDEYAVHDSRPRAAGHHHLLRAGEIEAVSPTVGDWHRVSNALADAPSVSIHVYGANIGAVRRQRLDDHGALLPFVSGYSTAWVPNLWDRSRGD